ncbi:nuclear transport factor 2 family protein [Streptomyces sp. NPDC051218]|uniref:nuclear transport factor 2 family protein n=1 Tax=Streptomyces sp. NPDC051218 TaxID=3365645 RepID=UPI0037AA1B8A
MSDHVPVRPGSAPLDVAKIFADIDSRDPDRFVAHLTEDVRFRFGNAPETVGREAVRQAVSAFYGTIAGLRHDLHDVWLVPGGGVIVVRADVTYLRHDGRTVTLPNADILRVHGSRIREWLIYIDLGPLYAP